MTDTLDKARHMMAASWAAAGLSAIEINEALRRGEVWFNAILDAREAKAEPAGDRPWGDGEVRARWEAREAQLLDEIRIERKACLEAEAALAELRGKLGAEREMQESVAAECDKHGDESGSQTARCLAAQCKWVLALLSPEGEAKGEARPPRDADPVPGTDLMKLATAVLNIAASTPKPLGLSKARMLAEQALSAARSAGITQGGTDV